MGRYKITVEFDDGPGLRDGTGVSWNVAVDPANEQGRVSTMVIMLGAGVLGHYALSCGEEATGSRDRAIADLFGLILSMKERGSCHSSTSPPTVSEPSPEAGG